MPRNSRWAIQDYPVPWRVIAHLKELVLKSVRHKMDFHPHDPDHRILDTFLTVLRGQWGNTEPETQLKRTVRFLKTYMLPLGIEAPRRLEPDAVLDEQLKLLVMNTLVPELEEFLRRNKKPRPEYYIPFWKRAHFYRKMQELQGLMQAQKRAQNREWDREWKQNLSRDLNRLMKPILKCEERAWSPALHGSPEQDVSIFFHRWLKDNNSLDPWVPFAHSDFNWTPELMMQDFDAWMHEIQNRIFALNRAAAGS